MSAEAAAGSSSRPDSALIVGKGEGGGKLDQGSDNDDPGGHNQQHEQGVDDEAATGRPFEASPEPGQGPGKLLGKQDDDQQKTGKKEDGPDNVIPGANDWKAPPPATAGREVAQRVGRVINSPIAPYLVLISDLYKIQAYTMIIAMPKNKNGCTPASYFSQIHTWLMVLTHCCHKASSPMIASGQATRFISLIFMYIIISCGREIEPKRSSPSG
jgi:hypothetical protein